MRGNIRIFDETSMPKKMKNLKRIESTDCALTVRKKRFRNYGKACYNLGDIR